MDLDFEDNLWQVVLGTLLLLLVLEGGRRTLGLVFPILVTISVLYALFGAYIPGQFGHRGFTWGQVIRAIYFSPQGFWGVMLQISSTLLAIFLIFSAVLLKSGGGDAFIDIAFLASAKIKGGPAQMAAIASGLFGMISGSATANAAGIGTFTIPLMKRAGFRAEFAGAVEAVAGTGGQIMPPIMGAAAFLMAQFLGISYAKVAVAAVIPALLYYAGLMFAIHLEATKYNFGTLDSAEAQKIRGRFTRRKLLVPLIPIGVLVYFFTTGYTVQFGAFWATTVGILTMVFLAESPRLVEKLSWVLRTSFTGFAAAGKSIADIAVLLASAQILVTMLSMTGLAVKFSDLLVELGHENMMATLVLAMIALIILGMGIPPPAVYVLGGAIIVPAMSKLGLLALPSHMFVFYFACLGAITPPVCAAVYVTSSLAKSNWWTTGWLAVRLALSGFVVPFMFIYSPSLLMVGSPFEIAYAALPAFVGVYFLSTFAVGYFLTRSNWFEQLVMLVAGILLIKPGWETDLVGLVLGGLVGLLQFWRRARGSAAESLAAPRA
jgi:TRAP transporter 4TM/12TM fusion protein